MNRMLFFSYPPRTGAEPVDSAPAPTIPPNILDSIRIALGPYMDSDAWEAVCRTIMSPKHSVQQATPEQEDRLLSTEELCNLLHTSRATVFRYMKAGKIKAYKLGRRNLFSLNEVLATLKNEEVANV